LSSPIEIVGGHEFNGYAVRFKQNGEAIDAREMTEALMQDKNTQSSVKESLRTAKTYDLIRNISVFPGALLVGYAAGTSMTGNLNWTALGGGLGFFGTALLFRMLYENQLDDAVRMHNQGLQSSVKFEPLIDFSGSSLKLGLSFAF
jgi:hypothetical protein